MMVAHAYPGFYDGITVQCTFVDLFTTGKHAAAGHLFRNFFDVASVRGTEVYTPADQAAVSGSPLATADDAVFDTRLLVEHHRRLGLRRPAVRCRALEPGERPTANAAARSRTTST